MSEKGVKMSDKIAPDYVLRDGTEVVFDMEQMTIAEYRSLFDPAQPDDEGDKIVAKVAGLEAERVSALAFREYRELMQAFFAKAREPLEEKNGESAST